jgi:hypothetical protein
VSNFLQTEYQTNGIIVKSFQGWAIVSVSAIRTTVSPRY